MPHGAASKAATPVAQRIRGLTRALAKYQSYLEEAEAKVKSWTKVREAVQLRITEKKRILAAAASESNLAPLALAEDWWQDGVDVADYDDDRPGLDMWFPDVDAAAGDPALRADPQLDVETAPFISGQDISEQFNHASGLKLIARMPFTDDERLIGGEAKNQTTINPSQTFSMLSAWLVVGSRRPLCRRISSCCRSST